MHSDGGYGMTGEDIIKYYGNGRFASYCGISLSEDVHDGSISAKAEVLPQYMNGSGHVHGGFIYTLADVTGGANCRRFCDRVTTLDSDFHFLSNYATRFLYGEAAVVRIGGKVIVLRVTIKGDTGEPFAEGLFTYYKV